MTVVPPPPKGKARPGGFPLAALVVRSKPVFHERFVWVTGVTAHESGSFVVEFTHLGESGEVKGTVLGAVPDELPPAGRWIALRWLQRAPGAVGHLDRWSVVETSTPSVPWIGLHRWGAETDAADLDARRARLVGWVGKLSAPWQHLVHAVFVDREVLMRFLRMPGSIQHHHAREGGLLDHSLEVAQAALGLIDGHPTIHRDLVLTGALLHDLGKVDEYELIGRRWYMSQTGHLVGHRAQGLIRIEQAGAREGFDADSLQHLIHVLVALSDQQWVSGLPNTKMLEATVVGLADRYSAASGVSEILCPTPGWSFAQPGGALAFEAKRHLGFRGIHLRPQLGGGEG